MTALFKTPKITNESTTGPAAPTLADPSALAAAREKAVMAGQAFGRQSTIATSGTGATWPPAVGKSSVLGG